MSKRYKCVLQGLVVWLLLISTRAISQEPFATIFEITSAQRLALEQIDQLVAGEQIDEAVELIVRTVDESDGRLVAVPRGREIENAIVRFVPLDLFLQDRLLRWGVTRPAILEKYRRTADVSAAGRLQSIRNEQDLARLSAAVRSMLATSYGDEALLILADRAMQRGWMWTAISALRRIDPRWQAVEDGKPGAEVSAMGWELILPKLTDESMQVLEQVWGDRNDSDTDLETAWPIGCYAGSNLPQAEVGMRLLVAYGAVGEIETAIGLGRLLNARFENESLIFAGKQVMVAQAIESVLSELAGAPESEARSFRGAGTRQEANSVDWLTLGSDASRVYLAGDLGDVAAFPNWVKSLDVSIEGQYSLPEEPATGWGERNNGSEDGADSAVRTVPIIHHGLVLLQKGKYLFAFDSETGDAWPAGNPNKWFYQHTEPDGIKPKSGLMPVDGQPWFALGAESGRVVGRFGPSESGWLEVVRPDLPLSQLVMLDLRREGQLLPGYPVRARSLYPSQSSSVVEFEGAPLIVGRRMFAGLMRRDNATLTTSVACYDVASGQLLYETELIASARHLPAKTANRMSSSLVSYREGVIYYHGDSGCVAAMDAENGDLLWLVRYPRAELSNSAYPRRRRASGGKASPVALLGPLAIVGPSDLDRLLAVDAMDGRFVWATAAGEADDVDQTLGEVAGRIIVGGDVLYCIDRTFGSVVDRWPAGTTSQIHGALPNPRRQGRGLMAGDRIYWPTADAIWIIDAKTLAPVNKLDLRPTGLVGGDLAAAAGILVIADGQRVAGFSGDSDKRLVSAATNNE